MSQQQRLNQHQSKGLLSPIMERTLESILSPSLNKSQNSNQTANPDERALTGTGVYKMKLQKNYETMDEEEDDDDYEDDFESESEED